jgi:hypothetical protein
VVASTITASFLALLLCGKTLLSPSPLDLPPAVPATDGQETNKHYNPNQNPSEPTSKMVKKLYDNLGKHGTGIEQLYTASAHYSYKFPIF